MTTSERLQDALEECKRISEVDAGSDDFLYASDRLVRLVERSVVQLRGILTQMVFNFSHGQTP